MFRVIARPLAWRAHRCCISLTAQSAAIVQRRAAFTNVCRSSLVRPAAPVLSLVKRGRIGVRCYKVASHEDVKNIITDNKEGAVLFDVRNPDEFASGAIPTATLIPLPQVPLALSLSEDDFKEAYGIDKPSRNTKIVFFCRSGARSASACEIARQAGIHNYEGSYLDWASRK